MKTFAFLCNLLPLALLVKGSAVTSGHGDKSVLCYFRGMNAALPEEEESRFTPEDIDLTICTHLVYHEATVNRDLEIEPKNRTVDLEEEAGGGLGLYSRTLALKRINPRLKVFLQVNDRMGSLGKNLTTENSLTVVDFSRKAAEFIQNHGFDGMLFFTLYPEVLHVVAPTLREEFARRGLQIMVYVGSSWNRRKSGFQLTESLSTNFDLIVVGSYWNISEEQAAIVSSMVNLERDVDGLKALGVPAEKLVVPIPAFSFVKKLCNDSATGVGTPLCVEEDAGTRAYWFRSFVHNREMRKKMANASEEWVVVRDEESKVPYGHSKSLHWASFEDPESVRTKASFILENNLAGGAIMYLEMEDFKGQYTEGGVKFPLTRALFNALYGRT